MTISLEEHVARASRRVRHKKRGSIYRVIGHAALQTNTPLEDMRAVVIYQCEDDGRFWVRSFTEFEDGRFEELEPAAIAAEREHAPDPAEAMRAKALEPFATFGVGVDGEEIRDSLMRDRICDWFGPSDFDAARAALKGKGEGRE